MGQIESGTYIAIAGKTLNLKTLYFKHLATHGNLLKSKGNYLYCPLFSAYEFLLHPVISGEVIMLINLSIFLFSNSYINLPIIIMLTDFTNNYA